MSEADDALTIRRLEADGSGVTALEVEGDLDLAVTGELERALDLAGWGEGDRVLLDLAAVRFIDSSGIRVVAKGLDAFGSAGIPAAGVVAPGSAVARAIELSGLDELLPLHPDRAAAVRRLAE